MTDDPETDTATLASGIELAYEDRGSASDPLLLLVNGLGSQLVGYPAELCDALVAEGFRVVRFDNRDVGRSTWLDDHPPRFSAAVEARKAGRPVEAPYDLGDLADDAVGLLDHLGVERAHVVGMSMGGMIVQTVAARHPERVASLCSIMSTTGEDHVGGLTREAQRVLLAPPEQDRDANAAQAVHTAEVIGSPGLVDADAVAARARTSHDRGFHPAGTTRQLLAVWASGDRSAEVATITAPTLVIHGAVDPLVDVSGGRRTAELIDGARCEVVDGMGHDLARPLWPRLVGLIVAHARAAGSP